MAPTLEEYIISGWVHNPSACIIPRLQNNDKGRALQQSACVLCHKPTGCKAQNRWINPTTQPPLPPRALHFRNEPLTMHLQQKLKYSLATKIKPLADSLATWKMLREIPQLHITGIIIYTQKYAIIY